MRFAFLECHPGVALVAQGSNFLVTFVALGALNLADLSDMIAVGILFEIFCPFGDRVERFMANETRGSGCGRLGLVFLVACRAGQPLLLVSLCQERDCFLRDGNSGPKHGCRKQK